MASGRVGGRVPRSCRHLGHVLVPRPIREQAVIPQAVEAAREHMQEDAPDELRRGQGHGLLPRCVGTAVVGVAEPDLPRVEGEEPLVGDGDPMRVPTDVIEHLVGPGEGWLGVDHPVGLPGGLEMGGKVLPTLRASSVPAKCNWPVSNASHTASSSSRRTSRESTRTGRKNPGRHDTHCVPSGESPPPGTTQWRWG